MQFQTPSSFRNYLAQAKQNRTKLIIGSVITLLLLIIAVETFIILEQKRVNQRIEAQSEEALGKFLKQGKPAAASGGTDILFSNVRFCWSKRVCINTRRLTATAVPLTQSSTGNVVVFDDLKSFMVRVHNAQVLISPQTLQGMFNESVFNYPGSNLRNLTVSIQKAEGANHIKLAGSLKYFLWIPFEMDTNLRVDRKTNTLVISVNTLEVFGFIPATWLIELKPFNLDKLLTLPPNRHLTVHQNLMMVKPFGLFPPPRIDGQMSAIAVMPSLIQLQFSGNNPAFANLAETGASNFIYLEGGNAQFGRIRMLDTQVQVSDQTPGDLFQFSLLNYLNYLPSSQIKLQKDGGIFASMPDHQNIPDMDSQIEHPKNDPRLQKKPSKDQPGFWQKTKTKVKDLLGL
jgi:hypothetical protein